MYDKSSNAAWPVQDPLTGDYRALAIPEHAPTRIMITCARCEREYVGSIFKAAREGFPHHKCRKPKRDRLRIW